MVDSMDTDVMENSSLKRKQMASSSDGLELSGKRMKFQSFPKAASKLYVSSAASTREQDEDVEQVGHFATRFLHWRDMNLTEGYGNFSKLAFKMSSKLVFVLHNKDAIKDLLVAAIKEGDEMCLEAFYDLTSAFAVDLQASRFGPFYEEFIQAFGSSFQEIKSSPDVLQAGYTALSQVDFLLACKTNLAFYSRFI